MTKTKKTETKKNQTTKKIKTKKTKTKRGRVAGLCGSAGPRRLNRLGDIERDVPRHLKDAMSQWGPPLLHRLARVGCQVPKQAVRVGTDCSGLEAPIARFADAGGAA